MSSAQRFYRQLSSTLVNHCSTTLAAFSLVIAPYSVASQGAHKAQVEAPSSTSIEYQLAQPWRKEIRDKDNDLLLAGLSVYELQSSSAPPVHKLRALAYYTNIRALLDVSSDGGFGRLYAKHLDQPITGVEYLAEIAPTKSRASAVFSIQIPKNFNLKQPCLVVAPSSGSRGVYGAVGVSGFWALNKGCAISYTDKGTGTGFYFTELKKQLRLAGEVETATTDWVNLAGQPKEHANHWVATRHAHSGKNVEKDWGYYTLVAADLGIRAINDHFKRQLTAQDVWVVASGISNAGAAVLAATEQDHYQLIDATMAGEPNVTPPVKQLELLDLRLSKPEPKQFQVHQGYFTFVHQSLYTPCANYAVIPDLPATMVFKKQAETACDWLYQSGLTSANTTSERAMFAQQQLIAMGVTPSALGLGPIYTTMGIWPALNANYASAYSRSQLFGDPCGTAYQSDDIFTVNQPSETQLKKVWALSSGIPPTAGIRIGQYRDISSQVPSLKDLPNNVVQTLCYNAWTFPELRKTLKFDGYFSDANDQALHQGLSEIRYTGNLRATPTIIVHGQADRLILPNHTSRPYFWLNRTEHRNISQLSYIEVVSGQHFDALLQYPPYNQILAPLHGYFEEALESLWQQRYEQKPLPRSGIIKPKMRQLKNAALEPLSQEHLPSLFDSVAEFSAEKDRLVIRNLKD